MSVDFFRKTLAYLTFFLYHGDCTFWKVGLYAAYYAAYAG